MIVSSTTSSSRLGAGTTLFLAGSFLGGIALFTIRFKKLAVNTMVRCEEKIEIIHVHSLTYVNVIKIGEERNGKNH